MLPALSPSASAYLQEIGFSLSEREDSGGQKFGRLTDAWGGVVEWSAPLGASLVGGAIERHSELHGDAACFLAEVRFLVGVGDSPNSFDMLSRIAALETSLRHVTARLASLDRD